MYLKYKDKNGIELKPGDLCFYTERPYSNYADSLCEVVLIGNRLCTVGLVCNFQGEYRKLKGQIPLSLEFNSHDETDPLVCTDTLIVSNNDVGDDLVKFMNDHFPLEEKL